jgi:ankyrin repeat protein
MDRSDRDHIKTLNAQLGYASANGQVDVINALIRSGAEINNTDPERYCPTPLMVAAQNGHAPAVQALLTAKANPNHTNKFGNTPLMLASNFGNPEVVRVLLAGGADPSLTRVNQFGRNALQMATDLGRIQIASQLVEKAEWTNEATVQQDQVQQPVSMDMAEDNNGRAQQGNAKKLRL